MSIKHISMKKGLVYEKIYRWFMRLSKRIRDSIKISFATVGMISTIFTIIGVSLDSCKISYIGMRLWIVFVVAIIIFFVAYYIIGTIFKDSVNLVIRKTPISITCGDIFDEDGLKVISCDTHFDTRVDDNKKVVAWSISIGLWREK